MIKEIINEYGRKANAGFGDRSKTVGASEIGLCARRICMTKKKTKTDAEAAAAAAYGKKTKGRSDPRANGKKSLAGSIQANWGAHVRGSAIEEHLWLPAMREKFGKDLAMAGKEQKTLTSGTLSATPDGLVLRRGHEMLTSLGVKVSPKVSPDVVVECKSIDPRVNLTEEKEENAFQVQVQMGLIRELTPYKPDYAVISYVDASFWHDVAEFAVPFKPDDFAAAKMRADQIIRADPHDLRPEGWIAGGKECNWCPYAKQCAAMRGGVPEQEMKSSAEDAQFAAEMTDLAKQYVAYARVVKDHEDLARGVQEEIKNRLKEKGVRRIPGIVNWYGVKGRESYDMEALLVEAQKKGIATDKFKRTGDPSSQLLVDKKVVLL